MKSLPQVQPLVDAIDAVMPAADADRQPCEAAQAAAEAVTELDELLQGDSGLADAYRVAFTLLGGLPTIVRLSLSTNAVFKAVGLREGANKALKELAKNSEIKTSLIDLKEQHAAQHHDVAMCVEAELSAHYPTLSAKSVTKVPTALVLGVRKLI
jgi:hypothetical protein